MPFDQDKWDDIVRQWESDEPGVSDVDTPPIAAGGERLLPEMDLSEPDADNAGGPSDNDEDNAMVLPEMDFSGPATSPTSPATVGAGKQGAPVQTRAEPTAPTPPPPPESLNWADLGSRLKAAELGQSQSRNYETMLANAGNPGAYVMNQHAGDIGPAMVQGEVGLAKEKQGLERGALQNKAAQASLGVKAAMDDPNSLQSQKAREAVKAMGVTLPRGFENYSASDIHSFVKTGELATAERARRADADRDAKAQAAAVEKTAKAAKAEEELGQMRKTWAPEFKKAGIDPTTATKFDLERVLQMRGQNLTAQSLAISKSNEERKAGEHEALTEGVPFAGSKLTYHGAGTPREDDRREVQKVASLYGSALAGMDDLGTALEDFARNPSPATKDNVASKAQVVSGHLNTAAGQGAMSKDEAAAMSAALGTDVLSPTGFQAFFQKVVGGDDTKAAQTLTRKLKSVRQTAKASALGKIRAYNYDADGASGGGAAVKMKFPDGSVHDVAPEKMEKARAKGGVPVDG
ncbi:MAG: hypothetical protein IPJ65_42815 [Archangiaceae bacterium]|nr:hypothetical protein [Archangiaceae bacterium]